MRTIFTQIHIVNEVKKWSGGYPQNNKKKKMKKAVKLYMCKVTNLSTFDKFFRMDKIYSFQKENFIAQFESNPTATLAAQSRS